jgi:actin-related protein
LTLNLKLTLISLIPTACQRQGKEDNMTAPEQNQAQQSQEAKTNDKELNFRALEAKYQKQLELVEMRAQEAERRAQEAISKKQSDEEDDDSDPYVDHKRLSKTLSSFEKRMEEKIDKKAEEKARGMIDQNKRESWLRQNPDFYEVLQLADQFAKKDPELAESILEMPEGFERQKLVYKNIKALGLHKPEVRQPSIQEKVDANRRSPYYQPSGVANAPYASSGDFSPVGQKNAYQKMQELKNKLRI